MADRTCTVDGCERPVTARGWCAAHYSRIRKHGDVQAHIPVGSIKGRSDGEFVERSSIEERFWPKVDIPANPLECWRWVGAIDAQSGYGRMRVKRKTDYAHRISYEMSIDTIGAGLEIDHLCRNRWCVNPLHLQAVPASVNIRRTPARQVTHCPQGHAYSGDNLREWNGRRYCRTCGVERAKEWREARKAS